MTLNTKVKFKADKRQLTWEELEQKIQARAHKKDDNLILKGPWKKFVRKQDGFNVYAVDRKWVKSNLSVIFGHGGHGYVHEFIPMDEIWCNEINDEITPEYFDSCAAHEIREFQEMSKGLPYYKAHQIAQQLERELGLIPEEQIKDSDDEFC